MSRKKERQKWGVSSTTVSHITSIQYLQQIHTTSTTKKKGIKKMMICKCQKELKKVIGIGNWLIGIKGATPSVNCKGKLASLVVPTLAIAVRCVAC